MRANEALTEFTSRLNILEARRAGIERIIATLDGIRSTFQADTAGIQGPTDKVGRLAVEYADARDELLIEIDNLKAAHEDAIKLIERQPPRMAEVLALVYIDGLSMQEAADRMGVEIRQAYRRHDAACALLDAKL